MAKEPKQLDELIASEILCFAQPLPEAVEDTRREYGDDRA